ncbi:MAG: 1-(5-phosphoribosyl)-5-[(5-phosphoribosylamino)methylideneamino]imidazole-4-carboxamide isomerase [Dehalococcoidia bacterium]|nr:1-(5-phosphoribosyl)-5-[(5-phosphoribosylamino)methylideneamino]imidazole-4-carboxamide isomerase [Dehalococcoidia bacterium]
MEIIPAVDIKGGKCVRLYQGDYSQETVFSENPVDVAMGWKSQGARRLHVIDLDGAAGGEPRNLKVIEGIVKRTNLPVQLGGGIRDEAIVARLLDIGIARVILGTVAVENPELVKTLCQRYGKAIVVGIDARDGYVATRGWVKETEIKALELGLQMARLGVSRIIYTDIKRDGTLTEPGFEAIEEMVKGVSLPIIAAGGISKLSHLRELKKLGVEGAIVGKAIYTGDINLKEALAIGI